MVKDRLHLCSAIWRFKSEEAEEFGSTVESVGSTGTGSGQEENQDQQLLEPD